MNRTSTDKIKSATPFLIWFRRCLPQPLQAKVRPYLDRPYQLALTILDCCDSSCPLPVKEIALAVGVAPQTVKQVLLALRDGGMTFAISPTHRWQLSQAERLALDPLDARLLETASANPSGRIPE